MNSLVIGLSGKKGSGKDHTCLLLRRCGLIDSVSVERMAFADSLKDEVARACGVDRRFIEGNKEHFRLILQGWGTEFRRQLHGSNYWVKQLDEKIGSSTSQVIVVTDVRFENEADLIHDCDGILIRMVAPDKTIDAHPSETALDSHTFDYTLYNHFDASLDDDVALLWSTVILPRLNAHSRVER